MRSIVILLILLTSAAETLAAPTSDCAAQLAAEKARLGQLLAAEQKHLDMSAQGTLLRHQRRAAATEAMFALSAGAPETRCVAALSHAKSQQ